MGYNHTNISKPKDKKCVLSAIFYASRHTQMHLAAHEHTPNTHAHILYEYVQCWILISVKN